MAFYLRDYLKNAQPTSAPISGSTSVVPTKALNETVALGPTRSEVFRFFYSFRTLVVPFHVVVKDVDALELAIFDFLNASEMAKSRGERASRHQAEQNRQETSLYLAVLSLGAQVSDLPSVERAQCARDLGGYCVSGN